jgi:hypothetical protein
MVSVMLTQSSCFGSDALAVGDAMEVLCGNATRDVGEFLTDDTPTNVR